MARRKESNDSSNKRNNKQSDSFALFTDDDVVRVVSDNNDTTHKAKEKVQKRTATKQSGSQAVDEKPNCVKPTTKEALFHANRGFRAIKKHQNNACAASDTDDKQGQISERVVREVGDSKKKLQGSGRRSKGSDGKTDGSKRKVQKSEGGTSVSKRKDSSGETLEKRMSSFKLKEFDVTDRIQNHNIVLGPRETDRWDVVEIVIGDYRYKVSPWSIRDGQYIQGLDSRFLVSKYRIRKAK